MKIYYFYNRYLWDMYGLPRALLIGLRELGHNIVALDGKSSILLRKNGDKGYGNRLPDVLKDEIAKIILKGEPAAVFFASSGLTFNKRIMNDLKSKGILLVGFGFSDPSWFETRGKEVIPNYSVYFSTSPVIVDKYNEIIDSHILYPFVYDEFYDCNIKWENRRKDVVFLGLGKKHQSYSIRKGIISELIKRGINIDVYGSGWEELGDNAKGPLYGRQLVKALNHYKLGLDVSRDTDAFPKKIFEYALCGCTPLVLDKKVFADCFTSREMLEFAFIPGLIEKCLGFRGKEVANRAKKKVLKEHTHLIRAKQIMDIVSKLI